MTITKLPSTSLATADHQRVVAFLRLAKSYADSTATVEVIETHISWVFLTKTHVYKLKKPVRFDFLDFSTLELREAAVREEIRLNRRLARDVYLDAVPITEQPSGNLRLGGDGRIQDWVVRMRRLPADRMLDELVRTRRVTERDIRRLGDTLAHYYSAAPPLTIKPTEYRQKLEAHVRSNRAVLNQFASLNARPLVKRVHTAQLRILRQRPELFDNRVHDGRIIDGHGDLRPEHICLTSNLAIFDCIEFNSEFRQIDVVDELCFLAMECEQMGATEVGEQILTAYSKKSGDGPAEQLVRFYKSYRACVRAKVAWLRSQQTGEGVAQQARELTLRYLHLADRLLAPLARPCLLVVCGVSGSGKSTLAEALTAELEMELLRTDTMRLEIFGSLAGQQGLNADRYSAANRRRVYSAMMEAAEEFLAGGISVVLDGAFLQAIDREAAKAIAVRHGALVKLIHCVCPAQIARRRIEERLATGNDPSEAKPELVEIQQQQLDPFERDRALLEIDTTVSLNAQTALVMQTLELP